MGEPIRVFLGYDGEQLRTLFETIDEGYCIMELVRDERGKILDLVFREVNAAFERHTGLRDVVGRTVAELLPNLEQHWIDIYTSVSRTGESVVAENYVKEVDRWYRVHQTSIGGPGSPFVAVVFDDITASKRAEMALRESEARLAAVIETLPIGIAVLDAGGRAELMNAEMLRFLPTRLVPSRDEENYRRWRSWHPDGRQIERDEFPSARALRGERVTPGVEMLYTNDQGHDVWTRLAAVPLLDDAGAVVGAIAALTDIDELKRLNDRLEERVRERTTEINELFERLISAQEEERSRIARDVHDQLGQQITALRMNLEALRLKAGDAGEWLGQLERIERVAEELDQSIDFLTWDLRPAALDHLGLSSALGLLVTGWSERFGIAAGFDVSGDDRARLPRDVEANLYRVVQEALHNVVKHAEATHVTVLLERNDQETVLVVEDNGRGFDPGKPGGRRSSMGLMSVRERTTLAGGQFDVESRPFGGTSVFVRIPAKAGRAR